MNEIIIQDLDFILNSNIDWEEFRNKTILITGAYGMLLSYMVYSLLHLNKIKPGFNLRVIALVRSKDKARQKFGRFFNDKRLMVFEHDLSVPIQLSEEIDYIIHGASYASPHQFRSMPVDVMSPNILGTYYLLKLAQTKKVKGFLFFSSGAVYGKKTKEVVAENDYGFLDPLDMVSCYSESKRMGENMCKCWYDQFGLPVKIVRPAHIYGPTMDIENDSRIFANFVKHVMAGQNLLINSDGSAFRSFCYIADATVAFFRVLLVGVGGEAYNVGNDKAYMSIKNLAKYFISAFPKEKIQMVINKGKEQIKGDKMLMSSKKLEKLGWQCFFSVPEGIRRTVFSFRGS